MSKAVKSVGRAISKVQKGMVNLVKKQWAGVKKFAKSKIGKVIIGAALIYFGGAALMGAMGTSGAAAAAGTSGLTGAAANVGAAWSSLGTAGSALAAGEFGTAASALGSGISGTAASAGGSALAGAGGSALAGEAVGTAANTAANTAFTGATETGLATLPGDAANVLGKVGTGGNTGMIGKMMSSQYAAPALIQGGTQLIGGIMQGKGAQQQQEQQIAMAEDDRKRYNTNIGTRLY
jgi:hypothetical protein